MASTMAAKTDTPDHSKIRVQGCWVGILVYLNKIPARFAKNSRSRCQLVAACHHASQCNSAGDANTGAAVINYEFRPLFRAGQMSMEKTITSPLAENKRIRPQGLRGQKNLVTIFKKAQLCLITLIYDTPYFSQWLPGP